MLKLKSYAEAKELANMYFEPKWLKHAVTNVIDAYMYTANTYIHIYTHRYVYVVEIRCIYIYIHIHIRKESERDSVSIILFMIYNKYI